jgi:hypothetical protein
MRLRRVHVLAAALAAAPAAAPAGAAAQTLVGPTTSRTFAGCATTGCAFLEVITGEPSDRFTPSGQPPVGNDWLGFTYRLSFNLNAGTGLSQVGRIGLQPSAGAISIDPDERLFVPSGSPGCSNLFFEYLRGPLTCTSRAFAIGFVTPNFELGSAVVPTLLGTPGAEVFPATATAVNITLTATPEPTTVALTGAGALALLGVAARRRRS